MSGWGWGMMIFWSFIWLGLLLLVGWAVVSWAKGSSPGPPSRPATGRPSAQELLDERFARGEIDVDEYERRRSALDRQPQAT